MLWKRSLVMYDAETESYWSHLLGEAMAGQLAGEKLEQVPSLMTDWKTWYAMHPETSVLWMDRTSERFRSDEFRELEKFVLGIELEGKPHAWSYPYLVEKQTVSTELSETPLFIVMDVESKGSRVYDRRVGGETQELTVSDGRIVSARGLSWDRMTGRSLGSHDALTPIPSVPSYKRAWMTFHPRSTVDE